ncbi:hypothetical protein [Zwartia sp.]|uniref:hypothetical protein n=1 Tax=Zwartia sp. TaxID=2978004 RepID=UPI003BAF0C6C
MKAITVKRLIASIQQILQLVDFLCPIGQKATKKVIYRIFKKKIKKKHYQPISKLQLFPE